MRLVQPSPIALLDIEEVRYFVNRVSANDDDVIQTAINEASRLFEGQTYGAGRPLAYRTVTMRVAAPAGCRLRVDLFPIDVTAALTVMLDGEPQTVWRTEADGDPEDFDVVVDSDDPLDIRTGARNSLWRAAGWGGGPTSRTGLEGSTAVTWSRFGATMSPRDEWVRGSAYPSRAVLSFSGGYGSTLDPIPDDLKLGVKYLVHKLVRDVSKQTPGLQAIDFSGGGGAILSETVMPKEAAAIAALYAPLFIGTTAD